MSYSTALKKMSVIAACTATLMIPLLTSIPTATASQFESQSYSAPAAAPVIQGQSFTVPSAVVTQDVSRDSYGATDPKVWQAQHDAEVAKKAAEAKAKAEAELAARTAQTKQSVVDEAMKYNNVTPYVFGGETPSGWDCSGFVKYVYGKTAGLNLYHLVGAEKDAGTVIPADKAVPGDVVVFSKAGEPDYHIGIYIGNGKMIHAPRPGKNTQIVEIKYFSDSTIEYVNLLK